MIESDTVVFSCIFIILGGEIRGAYLMSEGLCEHLIIKYSPDVAQDIENEEFTCNYVMWCNTSAMRVVWSFCFFSW